MKKENLIGSAGKRIVGIDCSEVDFTIKRLSEFNENWEIRSKCPSCRKEIYFTKNNVNKLIVCDCGKKLRLEIPDELL